MTHRTRPAAAARSACLTVVLLFAGTPLAAQGPDTTRIPDPPADRLAELSRFFGAYRHDDNRWRGAGPFRGTLDVGPAVKGWYVEWVINTHYGPVDRQLRMLTTWDEELGRYRIWRFETMPQSPPGAVEAEGRFEGEEFIMEWKQSRSPEGRRDTFRNRVRMEGPNQLVIVSEAIPEGGEAILLGTWRNQRVIAAPSEVGQE